MALLTCTTMRIQRFFDEAGRQMFRFLLMTEDMDVKETLVDLEDFDSSFHPGESYWYCFKSDRFFKQTRDRVIDALARMRYQVVLDLPTERFVNCSEEGEPYKPHHDFNIVREFCAKDTDYEWNIVFIKQI